MKKVFLLCMASAALILSNSCSKNNGNSNPPPPPKPVDEKITYEFLKKEVINFKVYKGSPGGGTDITGASVPDSFWNAIKLRSGYYDKLIVFKDSINELPREYEKNNFNFRTSNDTIYQWNRYADFWQLYGINKKDTIEHYMCFYNFQKSTPPYFYADNGHNDGIVDDTQYFNDTPHFFRGPGEMKSKDDVVALYNIKYIYVKKK